MKKSLLLAIMVTMSALVMAQTVTREPAPSPLNVSAHDPKVFTGVDGPYEKQHIAAKKFIPYVHVREADVMWSKTVWRLIDLREKMNLPLYYPTKPIDGRRSLMQVIYDAVKKGDLMAYDSGQDDEFAQRIPFENVEVLLGGGTTMITDEETGEEKEIANEARLDEVQRFLVKEVWWFDKKYSRMDVRIIGICPIRESATIQEDGSTRFKSSLTFWVYYPELRPFLSEQEVYNTRNDAQRQSYDDLMAQRKFASSIYRESNVYNNRAIVEYTSSLDANLESRRIHNELFVKEHDMWEY
ncbi:MAG: gliding motility protein GldN [Bacteroidales bacterium]|nr:gliding motility protein GldN [Bacteroidales bacterium]